MEVAQLWKRAWHPFEHQPGIFLHQITQWTLRNKLEQERRLSPCNFSCYEAKRNFKRTTLIWEPFETHHLFREFFWFFVIARNQFCKRLSQAWCWAFMGKNHESEQIIFRRLKFYQIYEPHQRGDPQRSRNFERAPGIRLNFNLGFSCIKLLSERSGINWNKKEGFRPVTSRVMKLNATSNEQH